MDNPIIGAGMNLKTDQPAREQLLEAIIAASLDCLIVIDESGRVVEFNPAAEKVFGYRRDEVIDRPVVELIVPARHRSVYIGALAKAAAGEKGLLGRRVETLAVDANGCEIPIELSVAEVRADGQRLFVASLRDLTERLEAERALRDSEAALAGFMANAPVGMYLKDSKGRYLLANPEMGRVFGRPPGELIGKSAADLLPAHEAEMVARHDAQVRTTRQSIAVEEHLEGHTDYEWTLVVRFPVDRGNGIEIGGFDIDIGALKNSELALQRSREALAQAEKLAAMGSLLAGVSHELNNPLAAIIGNATILEEELAGHPESERAARVRVAAERCAKIVRTFLASARQQPPVRKALKVNAVVQEALTLTEYGLRTTGICVEQALASELPPIWADHDQLHQAVLNLLVNAQQALESHPGDRRIRVSTDREADRVVIEIVDSGPGISPQVAARVFEPFFTTKPTGAGVGIGLSSAQGIIEAHGGRLELVEGTGGARFRITLPTGSEMGGSEQPHEAQPAGVARILIVDDEPEVAETLRDMLCRDGYEVTIALSAQEARHRLSAERFDLLLSDLRMSGEDGISLYHWLNENDPELAERTIFVTGDTFGVQVQSFLADSGRPVIEKPFTRRALRAALAALDE